MYSIKLFPKTPVTPIHIQKQSPEEFFITKKNTKRLKTSTCYSETIEKKTQFQKDSQFDMFFNSQHEFTKSELESTFGEDNSQFFKVKPKKRRNKRILSKLSLQCENEVHSEEETETARPVSSHFLSSNNISSQRLNSSPTPLQTSINDFQFIVKIGEGTYSEVFRVIHKPTGSIYALKIIEKQKIRSLGIGLTLQRQIKISMFLDQGNIAKTYHCFHDQTHIYLVCEYCTDKNLFELMNQPRLKLKKGLFTDHVTKIICQLCLAVRFMHSHYVMHRDIKPQNVLLTLFDTVKLCDLGWAVYNPDKEMRSTLCGTPLYLAPELISQHQYNQSVDIWAIGVLAFELMTEQNPFKIQKFQDLSKILWQQVHLEGIRSKVACNFIQKALEKDPNKRVSINELLFHPFLEMHDKLC